MPMPRALAPAALLFLAASAAPAQTVPIAFGRDNDVAPFGFIAPRAVPPISVLLATQQEASTPSSVCSTLPALFLPSATT